MIRPAKPVDEAIRLETLRALNILDTRPEERFDRLTRLAKRLFGVPIALVSLVDDDRQWFKSCIGLNVSQTTRDVSFCGHAILGDEIMVIPDARLDERFHDNPLVVNAPHVRFYAGCPLKVANGSRLGTLCLIDVAPRVFDADDLNLLRDLAHMAQQELTAAHMATIDELTGLSNRRGFHALARRALLWCRRVDRPATLLFVDLDRFKYVNDCFGHAEGDRALCSFAGALKKSFRDSDVIGRLGGDEFTVLLTNAGQVSADEAVARLHDTVDALNRSDPRGYDIEFSAGRIEYNPQRHLSVDELMQEADALMYARKHARRAKIAA